MRKTSWLKAAAAMVGLAIGGTLYGQSADISEPSLYKTQDGILATNYFNALPRNKDINVDYLISGGNITNLTVLDPIFVLKNKINYLKNDSRAKDFYASKANSATGTLKDEARLRLINIYEQLLAKVMDEQRTPEYYKSLDQFARAINYKDHIATAKELEGILGGVTYVIDKMGKKSNGEMYDVPLLVYFPVEQPKPKDESMQIPKQPEQPKQNLPLPQVPAYSPQATPTAQETKKSNLELYLDILSAPGLLGITTDKDGTPYLLNPRDIAGFVSARAGLVGRINDWFELGGNINAAVGFPENVDSTQTQPSPTGRYFVGSKINDNFFRLGADVEFYFGDNFFIGAGPNVWIYGQKTSEQLLDSNNNVVASNTNESMKATPSLDAYLGIRKDEVGVLMGWDSRKGFYAGARIMFPLK